MEGFTGCARGNKKEGSADKSALPREVRSDADLTITQQKRLGDLIWLKRQKVLSKTKYVKCLRS